MTEKIATRQAYGEVLQELGKEYPNLVVMDADLSGSTKTAEFRKVFPERFFNMGIAEQNLYGQAAGLALSGKIVCARDQYGNCVIGPLPGWSVRSFEMYTALQTTIQDVTWRETIKHDPIA